MILLFLIQAAATPPDIVLDLRATARDVRIERRGETSLSVRASPDGGSRTEVDRPESNGRARLRDVDVAVRAEARIAAPQDPAGAVAGEAQSDSQTEETREPLCR